MNRNPHISNGVFYSCLIACLAILFINIGYMLYNFNTSMNELNESLTEYNIEIDKLLTLQPIILNDLNDRDKI